MYKKLLITTALSGLMLSAAVAQYSSPSTPNAAQSGSSASDTMTQDSSKSDMSKSSASASGSMNFISAQKPDQLLASRFEGTDVIGQQDEKIGDVSDILFTKDGKIDAYIISVGGFLGVGAKEVALAPSAVQVMEGKDQEPMKLKVNLNKDQLAQAPDFEQHQAQRTTTGSAPGSTAPPRSAPGGGMAPGGGTPSR